MAVFCTTTHSGMKHLTAKRGQLAKDSTAMSDGVNALCDQHWQVDVVQGLTPWHVTHFAPTHCGDIQQHTRIQRRHTLAATCHMSDDNPNGRGQLVSMQRRRIVQWHSAMLRVSTDRFVCVCVHRMS